MPKLRIGIATCDKFPDLSADDQLFSSELVKLRVAAAPVIWDDENVEWGNFSCVVIRSCWDYHRKPDEFLAWLDLLEQNNVNVWNPVSALRGNMRKTYLRDLQARGIAVVPTEFLNRGDDAALADVLERRDWKSAVVKPDISASSFQTRLVARENAGTEQAYFQQLLNVSGVMVQPFLPEVAARGEWSFVFIDGEFSHAALKRPKAGDFRVQDDFGGSQVLETPSLSLLQNAAAIAACIPEPWLYARVDGVEIDGVFTLMELELIEPSLFLLLEPRSAERLARATLRRVSS
jgi:glutathione synthase/RimK-type ligase-like ATP-grasp enzyme